MAAARRAQVSHNAVEVWLWPCNIQSWQHWQSLQTQWRTGAAGATGLDYCAVRAYLDDWGVVGEKRQEVLCGIYACETAVLQAWRERAKEKDRKSA